MQARSCTHKSSRKPSKSLHRLQSKEGSLIRTLKAVSKRRKVDVASETAQSNPIRINQSSAIQSLKDPHVDEHDWLLL